MSMQEWLAIGMLVAFFVHADAAGVPVGITLATSGFVFGFLGFGETLFNLLPARIYGVVANYQWLAIPLFVFMGVMLEKSRLAEDLLDVIGHIAGGVRGGMALGIILRRRADGGDHRHRRRHRHHAGPADAADAAAARLRPRHQPAARSAPRARSGRSSRRA